MDMARIYKEYFVYDDYKIYIFESNVLYRVCQNVCNKLTIITPHPVSIFCL